MIDVREAARIAATYFKDLYDMPLNDVLVEEVEFSESSNAWIITLGYRDPTNPIGAIAGSRRYKRFEIDAEDGTVRSMKIRTLQDA